MTLANELDDDLVAELGIKDDAFVDLDFRWQHSRTTGKMQTMLEPKKSSPATLTLNQPPLESSGDNNINNTDRGDFDSIWDGSADAFQ